MVKSGGYFLDLQDNRERLAGQLSPRLDPPLSRQTTWQSQALQHEKQKQGKCCEEPYKSVCQVLVRPPIDLIQVLLEALLVLLNSVPNRGVGELAAWASCAGLPSAPAPF
eukprot:1137612-Pelagomonas_calceolata.AAC.2